MPNLLLGLTLPSLLPPLTKMSISFTKLNLPFVIFCSIYSQNHVFLGKYETSLKEKYKESSAF